MLTLIETNTDGTSTTYVVDPSTSGETLGELFYGTLYAYSTFIWDEHFHGQPEAVEA